jgi:hypothetical protein
MARKMTYPISVVKQAETGPKTRKPEKGKKQANHPKVLVFIDLFYATG